MLRNDARPLSHPRAAAPRRAAWPGWLLLAALAAGPQAARASDHADPIDIPRKERLEGVITDLFAFPILADGTPASAYRRAGHRIPLDAPDLAPRPTTSAEERAAMQGLCVILCVRRSLADTADLRLTPYTYALHLDVSQESKEVAFATPAESAGAAGAAAGPAGNYGAAGKLGDRISVEEARVRYGGLVLEPDNIKADVTLEFVLEDDASLKSMTVTGLGSYKERRVVLGAKEADKSFAPDHLNVITGIFDDPFIFPVFFGTNVVAMVVTIPMSAFLSRPTDFLLWGTSRKGGDQFDHVGRSIRTQNPRFEILNKLHPSEHRKAVLAANANPTLLRDIALRAGFQQTFAYRRWDFEPDVMVLTTQYPIGFPNGRLVTDDVAALAAQFGDTLLLEIAHQAGGWPRRETNDMPFPAGFPYLAAPHPMPRVSKPPVLTSASRWKLAGFAAAGLVFLILFSLVIARWYHRWRLRREYR